MRMKPFLFAACILAVSALEDVIQPPSSTQNESSNVAISTNTLASMVLARRDITTHVVSFCPLLPKLILVSKEFEVSGREILECDPTAIDRAFFTELGPCPERDQLFELVTGIMKGRLDKVFGPGSALWPLSAASVKYAVLRVANSSVLSEYDKIAYFDRFSAFLGMNQYFDALAALLFAVPPEYSKRMHWKVFCSRSIIRELIKRDSRCFPHLLNIQNLFINYAIFAEMLSGSVIFELVQPFLSPELQQNGDFIAWALIRVGRACASQQMDDLSKSPEDLFQRNVEFVSWLTASASDNLEIMAKKEYALLINAIRFAPEGMNFETQDIFYIDSMCRQTGIKLKYFEAVYDALSAAMFSRRRALFEAIWREFTPRCIPNEFVSVVGIFPEFAQFLSFSDCNNLLLRLPNLRQKWQIVRSRPDIYHAGMDIQSVDQGKVRFIIAVEVYTADKFMSFLKSSSEKYTNDIDCLTFALYYLADLFDELPELFLQVFRFVFEQLRKHSEWEIEGRESLLRLLLSGKIDDSFLQETLTGGTINPSLQFIHTLFTDEALANAIGTDHACPIRNCLSAKILTTPTLKYNLNGNQILHLLKIMRVKIDNLSFTLHGDVSSLDKAKWLNAHARTFGDMARSATDHPGFLACLAYCVAVSDLERYTTAPQTYELNGADRFWEELDRDGWPKSPYESCPPLPSLRHEPLSASIASGSPNPVLFGGFDMLYLWVVHNPENFKMFAPETMIKVFLPISASTAEDSCCQAVN